MKSLITMEEEKAETIDSRALPLELRPFKSVFNPAPWQRRFSSCARRRWFVSTARRSFFDTFWWLHRPEVFQTCMRTNKDLTTRSFDTGIRLGDFFVVVFSYL